MELLFFAGGIIVGGIAVTLANNYHIISGTIDVDHTTNMCKVKIETDELLTTRKKKVNFRVNHEAKISREEQGL